LDRQEPVRVMSGITPLPNGGLPFRFTKRPNEGVKKVIS